MDSVLSPKRGPKGRIYSTPQPEAIRPSLKSPNYSSPLSKRVGGRNSPMLYGGKKSGDSFSRLCLIGSSNGGSSRDGFKVPSESTAIYLNFMKQRRLETLQVIEAREKRKKLCFLLKRKYGIKFSRSDSLHLPFSSLVNRAVEYRAWTYAMRAATRMLAWFRQVQLSHKLALLQRRSHMAAFIIQQWWRKHYREVVAGRREKRRKETAAVVIQRWVRGHQARERVRKKKVMHQINCLHFHYERVRYRELLSKAPVILKSWKAYKQRKLKPAKCSELSNNLDIFKTSIKAPPMRTGIPRPDPLAISLSMHRMKGDKGEEERAGKSSTEGESATERKSRDHEPNTAPLPPVHKARNPAKSQRNTQRRQTRPLERIAEIS